MTDATTGGQVADTSHEGRLVAIVTRIGETVAGPQAYDVDLNGRFPAETIDALKQNRVLSALIPTEFGGMGATLTECSDAIRVLSRYCAASGCVLAMHTSDIFVLLKYGTTPALRGVLEEIADQQLLVANATSEVKLGGDVSRSIAALQPDGDGWWFDKQVFASSFGLYADLITSTIRRSPEAAESDQVLALLRTADLGREPTSEWNTMGLRGTCSRGLHLTGRIDSDVLYPLPFAEIASAGGQVIHVLLTAVWMGLAEAALEEAHAHVRKVARRQIDTVPQVAIRLAELFAEVQAARSTLADALVHVEAAAAADAMDDHALRARLRNVKLVSTNTAVQAATAALQICGVPGFRRGPDHRLERILRDAFGGLVMISNDRYLAENAQLLRVLKTI